MQRLLKLMEHRNSVSESKGKEQAIFDVRTYQRVFQRHPCSTAFQKTYFNTVKRLSFSEYSRNTQKDDYLLSSSKKASVKEQIKPHQSHLEKKVVERIREKIQKSKVLAKTQTPKREVKVEKQKKTFQSAYITARKKIFEKQLQVANSENQILSLSKKLEKQNEAKQIDSKEKELLILNQTSLDSINLMGKSEEEDQERWRETRAEVFQKKRNVKYLERVIANRRETQSKCEEFNIITSKFQGREATQTPTLRKGFISLNRKKVKNSNLIINSPKKKAIKKEDEGSEENGFKVYLKNFINKKKLGQDDIEIFPDPQFKPTQRESILQRDIFDQITSRAVSIFHIKDNQINIVISVNQQEKLQIASITKVMTCFLVLTIAEKFCINIKKERVIVNQKASKMPGTSARLAYSDTCTVFEMLHGLMLPSGNDAAIVLGQWGGKAIRRYSSILRRMRPPDSPVKSDKSLNFLENYPLKRKSHLKLFIHHMNKMAKFFQLKHTHFVNTHGLMNQKAYSCAQDVTLLCYYAMRHVMFRQIVSKKTFECKLFNRTFSHTKEILWENTNKLLTVEGFKGIKTGVTPAAGPCLASYFEISPDQYFIITILKTRSCEMRFKETASLLKIVLQEYLKSEKDLVLREIYCKALADVQNYTKANVEQIDTEILNDCKESSTSNSDREDQDQDLQIFDYQAL